MKFVSLCMILFSVGAGGAVLKQPSLFRKISKSQALQDQSRALDRVIQSYAAKLKHGDTFEFLRTLRLCAPCNNYERFGEKNDGGYVMCTDGLENGLVGAYSYGINGFDGWGMAMASRFNIPLNEFDCFNLKRPAVCHGCIVNFKGECISGHNAPPKQNYKTLTEQFQAANNSNTQDGSLLLKIDVEGAEWQVFAQEPLENMRKFRQIVVEYHNIGQQHNHGRYLQAVKNVEQAGFAVTHLHGNNCCGDLKYFGEYSIPDVLEVTYLRHTSASCAAGIPYHIPGVDQANLPWNPEMPNATLPQ